MEAPRESFLVLTKRQKEILDFIEESIRENGYAPSLHEIATHFKLLSISTVHKHLVHLEEKGLIQRHWNRARAIELPAAAVKPEARKVPVRGVITAGRPIEAIRRDEGVAVPEDMIGDREVYILEVKGDSMTEEQLRGGDHVVVESRTDPKRGEVVVALVDGEKAFVRKFFYGNGEIQLESANPRSKPISISEDRVAIQGVVVGLLRNY